MSVGRSSRRVNRAPAAIVAAYIVLAAAFATVVPPFEAPDETGHLFYIDYVAQHLALPNQEVAGKRIEGEGHQFPLYYAVAAAIVRAGLSDHSVDVRLQVNRDSAGIPPHQPSPKFIHVGAGEFAGPADRRAFYALRAFDILLGAITVVLTWYITGELGLSYALRLFATTFVATLPQFLFISASVNNDNLATLLVTVAILFLLRFCRSPTLVGAGWFGLALGLSLCTKKSALFLIPVFAVAVIGLAIRRPHARSRILSSALVGVLVAALITGWVFTRETILYGDPLGSAMERRTLPELVQRKSLLDRYWLDPFLPQLARSFVGVFGWMDIQLPSIIYVGYFALTFVAALGLGRICLSRRLDGWLGLQCLIVVACFAAVVTYNLTYTQYQGRFLFPVVAIVGALLARGLWESAHALRLHAQIPALAAAIIAFFLIADLVSLTMLYRFYWHASAYV